MPDGTSSFFQRLEESGLLSESIESCKVELEELSSIEEVSEEIVRRNLLTAYQASVASGKETGPLAIGDYVVEGMLGQGGMGLVLRGRHRRMKRQVAIKFLHQSMTDSPDLVARFEREVEAAAQLHHPNVVTAYDAGEHNGSHYLVMQFIEGQDLSQLVRQSGPLSIADGVDVIRQAAEGLAYAHEKGIVHRDIKPGNLLLDDEGVVRILDMGLARIKPSPGNAIDGGAQADLTNTGSVMGTIDYMAPEQALDAKTADLRADIYSLGCTLYFLLTGNPPFRSDTVMRRLLAHREQDIPLIRNFLPEAPPAIDAVFARMMAKSTDGRFQSMRELTSALDTLLQDHPPSRIQSPAGSSGVSDGSESSNHVPPVSAQLTQLDSLAAPASANPTNNARPTSQETLIESESQFPETATFNKVDSAPSAETFLRELGTQEFSNEETIVSVARPAKPRRGMNIIIASVLVVATIGFVAFSQFGKNDRSKSDSKSDNGLASTSTGDTPPASEDTDIGSAENTKTQPANHPVELSFDGVDDYVQIPDLRLDQTQPLTIEAWVTPRSLGTNSAVVSGGGIALNSHPKLSVWNIVAHGEDGGWGFARRDDLPIVWNERAHLAGTFANNKLCMFINGELIAVKGNVSYEGWDSDTFLGADQVSIGKDWTAGFFDGSIDEVRISNSARYTDDFVPDQTFQNDDNTLALYHFDEGSGTQLKDASGNDFHGAIYGATWGQGEQPSEVQPDFALSFDGVDDYVRIPSLQYETGKPFTIEATVSDWGNEYGVICGWRASAALSLSSDKLMAGLTTTDMLKDKNRKIQRTIRKGRPLRVALVYDGSQAQLFADGQAQGTLDLTAPLKPSESTMGRGFAIGAIPDGPDRSMTPLKARIDEVRVSKIARYIESYTPKPRLESDENTVALFHFDEGRGSVLRDSSGNENHGTIHRASWTAKKSPSPPLQNFALSFDGVDDYVDFRDVGGLQNEEGKPFTIEATVRGLDPQSHHGEICGWRASAGLWAGLYKGDQRLGLHYTTEADSSDYIGATPTEIPRDNTLHLALVNDTVNLNLYINGVLTTRRNLGSRLRPSRNQHSNGFAIGADSDSTAGFRFPARCIVDEVRVSDSVRYTENYSPTLRLESDENTTALFHFDEGQDTILRDSSGNENHGTIHGATWVKIANSAFDSKGSNGSDNSVK